MNCPEIDELERFVERDLDEDVRSSVVSHISGCARCAQEVSELEENLRLAASLRREGDDHRFVEPDAIELVQIGPYRIIRKLGQGGMGTVFEAEQENPRRTVALKVIRPGLVSHALMKRFRREAHVLGRLQHPGIAQIYEAGTHQSRHGPQPYFVMELVHGPTLIDYAQRANLDARARLELMSKVCDAVQHAHERGVIHRDLKPDNILIDDSSRPAQPKILDFGVARVLDPEGQQTTTLQTNVGQIVGTVAYMSPEQASADPSEIDTRADVYALGVICYELLSGKFPYKLNAASVAESVRAIVQDEPMPLSSINRSLRGDVTTIVSKALEKEKSRRYASAASMAEDLRRHLRDEPITARQPSTIYQLRKFARRNKGLVAGVAAAFVLLIVGTIGTSLGMISARRSAAEARGEVDKQTAVNAFLQEMLGAANPRLRTASDRAKGRDITVLDALNEAAAKVDAGSLKAQPEIEIAVRSTIGATYQELGEYAPAAHHLEAGLDLAERTYGPEEPKIADFLNTLAIVYQSQGKLAQAESLYNRALAMIRKSKGEEHPSVAAGLNNLGFLLTDEGKYSEAETMLRASLRMRRKLFGEEHRDVATSMHNLARTLQEEQKLDEAEQLFRSALAMRRKLLGNEHPDVANALNSLAFVLREHGQVPESEAMFREVLSMRRKMLGEEHPSVATTMLNLGSVLQAQRKFTEAEPLYRQAMEIQRKQFGDEHASVATTLNNLATLLLDQGKISEAEPIFRQALQMRRKALGEEHPAVALGMLNLGAVLLMQSKFADAEPFFRQALDIRVKRLGDDHADTAIARTQLGRALAGMGRFEDAERELLSARRVLEGKPDSGVDRITLNTRAVVKLYESWGKPELAEKYRATTRPATTQSS